MKKIYLAILCLLFSVNAFAAQPATRIVIEPLQDISFNTVVVGTSFVTCNTGLINRKEINIFNTSSVEKVYLGTSATPNTASITSTRWLFPRQSITLALNTNVNIYASCDTVAIVNIVEIR